MWKRKYLHILGEVIEALPEEKRRLGWLCFLALLAHGLIFGVVKVSYPITVPKISLQPQITLFSPEPQGTSLGPASGFWYLLNDPAILIQPRAGFSPDKGFLSIRPRQEEALQGSRVMLPLIEEASFFAQQANVLQEQAALGLKPAPQRFAYPQTKLPIASSTMVEWEEPLATRFLGASWDLPVVTANLLDEAQVSVLRLGVDESGQVQHALIEQRSGNGKIDELALTSARQLRFKPVPLLGVTWGRVIIYWRFVAPVEAP
jgi:hypothetical protein